jgi:thiol-disulfide isomerase/thioredoxin
MLSSGKRNCLWLLTSLMVLLGFSPVALPGEDPRNQADTTGPAARAGMSEVHGINREWEQVLLRAAAARRTAKSPSELERVRKESLTNELRLVERCADLANRLPGSIAGLIALKLVACRSPETEEGKKAAEALVQLAASADLDVLAEALDFSPNVSDDPVHLVAPVILNRVKKNPSHPLAAKLLASIVCGSADRDAVKPPREFIEAANMIVARYADSPDIQGFCEMVEFLRGSQTWPAAFEQHLRTILDRNQHRAVRAAASYALAAVVAAAGESRQGEAEKLYEEAIKTFDGSEDYFYTNIEKQKNSRAKDVLAEIKSLGKPAPEIGGVDLDGRGMTLSEYRGRIVLLSFWATWCGPCMQMVPHERAMVQRLDGKPFALVGVNGDFDQQAAKAATATHGMTWRSFQNKSGDESISVAWHVWGWPTFYLIDEKGIIRKRWTGTRLEELNHAIDELIAQQSENQPAK